MCRQCETPRIVHYYDLVGIYNISNIIVNTRIYWIKLGEIYATWNINIDGNTTLMIARNSGLMLPNQLYFLLKRFNLYSNNATHLK